MASHDHCAGDLEQKEENKGSRSHAGRNGPHAATSSLSLSLFPFSPCFETSFSPSLPNAVNFLSVWVPICHSTCRRG